MTLKNVFASVGKTKTSKWNGSSAPTNPNAEAPAGIIWNAAASGTSLDNNSKASTTFACTAKEEATNLTFLQRSISGSRKSDNTPVCNMI